MRNYRWKTMRYRHADTTTREEWFFSLTEHESKEPFRQYFRPGGPLSRHHGESMKQSVSRRRRCWTLLTQMDPVKHLSEGHRSGMLLVLSGLTREERVMVQASISNERDLDSCRSSHRPTSTYSPPGESKTSEGQRQRRIQTC